jgi:hypothetical protein
MCGLPVFADQATQIEYCIFASKDAFDLSWGRLFWPNMRIYWAVNRFGAEHD